MLHFTVIGKTLPTTLILPLLSPPLSPLPEECLFYPYFLQALNTYSQHKLSRAPTLPLVTSDIQVSKSNELVSSMEESLLLTLQFVSPQLPQTVPPHLVLSSLPVTFQFLKHWCSPGSLPMVSSTPLPTSLLTAPQSIVSLPGSGAGVHKASCFIPIFIWMFGVIWISNRPQNEVILFLAPTWFLDFLSL